MTGRYKVATRVSPILLHFSRISPHGCPTVFRLNTVTNLALALGFPTRLPGSVPTSEKTDITIFPVGSSLGFREPTLFRRRSKLSAVNLCPETGMVQIG